MKGVCAISTGVEEGKPYARDFLYQNYGDYFASLGLVPVYLATAAGADRALEELPVRLLVLSGGNDLGSAPRRDAAESALLARARERGLPVLGVCRGLQMINAHMGGTVEAVEGHVGAPHPVRVSDPAWAKALGPSLTVNSFHKFGVREKGLAAELRAMAVSPEGVVEALYHPGLRLAAVQWHPERPGSDAAADRRLVERLVEGPW